MLAGLLSSLLGSVIKNLITELIGGLFGYLDKRAQDAAQRDLGRVTAEREQALAGLELQRELAVIAARPVTTDDVLGRLDRGVV